MPEILKFTVRVSSEVKQFDKEKKCESFRFLSRNFAFFANFRKIYRLIFYLVFHEIPHRFRFLSQKSILRKMRNFTKKFAKYERKFSRELYSEFSPYLTVSRVFSVPNFNQSYLGEPNFDQRFLRI